MKNFDEINRMFYREGSDDLLMIREVMVEKCYRLLDLKPSDIVLDLGANIGTFAKKYHKDVEEIISVEPFDENCKMFKQNLEGAKNVVLIEKAVSNFNCETLPFFISKNLKYAGASLFHKRGYTKIDVKVISLRELISIYNPTKIKCDIEYGEFDVDWGVLKQSNVEIMVIEIHNNTNFKLRIIPLVNKLKSLGFDTNFRGEKIVGHYNVLTTFWREVDKNENNM